MNRIVTLYDTGDDVNYVEGWKQQGLKRGPIRSLTFPMREDDFQKMAVHTSIEESKDMIRDILKNGY